MIPIPGMIYSQVTFPLQLAASRQAAKFLELLRVPVFREGNVLFLPHYALQVVEACSGIRALMSLVALAVAYGYLAEGKLWIRIALVALMLPIAVASNTVRVVGAGMLSYRLGPGFADGFFHGFSGWLTFLSAVLLMLAAHRLLRRMVQPRRAALA